MAGELTSREREDTNDTVAGNHLLSAIWDLGVLWISVTEEDVLLTVQGHPTCASVHVKAFPNILFIHQRRSTLRVRERRRGLKDIGRRGDVEVERFVQL